MKKTPKTPWYKHPRKRWVYPWLFSLWLLTVVISTPFWCMGQVYSAIENYLGGPLLRIKLWCENYDRKSVSVTVEVPWTLPDHWFTDQ